MRAPRDAAELRQLAREDALHAAQHGSDLNPFSTQGARREWARGFEGLPSEWGPCSRHWWRGHYAAAVQGAQQ